MSLMTLNFPTQYVPVKPADDIGSRVYARLIDLIGDVVRATINGAKPIRPDWVRQPDGDAISFGEFLDRATILAIREEITNCARGTATAWLYGGRSLLQDVTRELLINWRTKQAMTQPGRDVLISTHDLIVRNTQLWLLEDQIRELGAQPLVDNKIPADNAQEIAGVALAIAHCNDARSRIKHALTGLIGVQDTDPQKIYPYIKQQGAQAHGVQQPDPLAH